MKKILLCTTSFVFLLLTAFVHAEETPNPELQALFREEWEFRVAEDPGFATSVGRHEHNDRLASMTIADLERRNNYTRGIVEKLRAIDREKLNTTDKVSYDLFLQDQQDALKEFEFQSYLVPINADSGFHIGLAQLPRRVPLFNTKDYENYIARLGAFPKYMEEHIVLMREGLKKGMTVPAVILQGYDGTISSHVVENPEVSVFYTPFKSFPSAIPASDQTRLRELGKKAILDSVVPAYKNFLTFMQKEYMPGARKTLGASELPNGKKYYQYLVQHYTTLNLSPEEVHKIGLQEVARIRKEMEEVIKSVNFSGDFAAFLKFLRTDPRFYVTTPEQLLKEASFIAKKMDGKLPSLFKTLPRLPYGVEPVPAHMAPKYTAGRYVDPAAGSTEPGYYWVNTYALESRPLYALEALTLHEAVPGHHLQGALASEMQNIPEFRKFLYLSAFGEGWGLYSEYLGIEAGFYKDPYSQFGRLTYEMWRACRLVVDTGIHAMGWTREQAIEFLGSNTALSLHEVTTETDRYISWPGRALAYKIGELKIRELRKKAEAELGPRFDVREFHDAVLGNGSVTLPVLERLIQEFIAANK